MAAIKIVKLVYKKQSSFQQQGLIGAGLFGATRLKSNLNIIETDTRTTKADKIQ